LLGAIAGLPRGHLIEAIERGFPFLPSGCSMALDAVAQTTVLRSLRTTVEARWAALVAEARAVARAADAAPITLATFLQDSGRELDDIYRHGSWTRLVHDARLREIAVSDEVLDTCQRLRHLVHIDDPDRLQRIESLLDGCAAGSATERREALMLGYQIEHETQRFMAAEEVGSWLRDRPAARDELRELVGVLAERVSAPASVVPVAEWPLVLHRHYMRREILTACGYWTEAKKTPQRSGRVARPPITRPRRSWCRARLEVGARHRHSDRCSPSCTPRHHPIAVRREILSKARRSHRLSLQHCGSRRRPDRVAAEFAGSGQHVS